ncbi:MAG: MATE family efflux transporter [Clostridia bacterium]|nr:MATE family efflux transporter [Clostridia bacterium]
MLRTKSGSRAEMDMTSGPILPNILLFSAPLILSSILQLLYNAADIIVVGRFAGAEALAAVGSTSSLVNLLVNLFIGLSAGASVTIARCYGAGDYKAANRGVSTAISLALTAGVLVMAVGFFGARQFLTWMGTPDNVLEGSSLYLKIFFLGMPFNMLYNYGAAVMRAVGDTKRPLYYLTFSGIVNLLLNLLLVIVFRMSVAGVAIATVTSQVISCALVLRHLIRTDSPLKLDWRHLGFDPWQLKTILIIGLPAGLQSILFSLSNVLIQSSVNSFGSDAMAGNAASSSVEGFVYAAMNALHHAALTFSSQNVGARKPERVQRTLWICLGVVTAVGLGLGFLLLSFGRPLLALYNADPEVIRFGMMRMSIILPTYFLCGIMDTMVGQLRGVGFTILPMVVSLLGACALRIVWIMTVFAANPSTTTLYISYPISWFVTLVVHFICYMFLSPKKLAILKTEAA